MSSFEQFPLRDWRVLNERAQWQGQVTTWFGVDYKQHPRETMEALLDFVFEAIKHDSDAIASFGELLRNYAEQHMRCNEQDLQILELIGRGLDRYHSHLFMFPQITKYNLLRIKNYSTILLATKYYAAGNYNVAVELGNRIRCRCSLAKYIVGQSYRRLGNHSSAHHFLDQGIADLENWDIHDCPLNKNQEIMCNKDLLEAELNRAKAVVFRKEGRLDESEAFFLRAELSLKDLGPEAEDSAQIDSTDMIWAGHERTSPYRVKADVYFGHGYYHYSQCDYRQAESLFRDAIKALEEVKEKWDSPYTRLAIIHLRDERYQDAATTFTKAFHNCEQTPVKKNREAPLSMALCALGLELINKYSDDNRISQISQGDPIALLKSALNRTPRLTLGPLECHRDDAKHILESVLPGGEDLVQEFIELLEQEINLIKSPPADQARILLEKLRKHSVPDETIKQLSEIIAQKEAEPEFGGSKSREKFNELFGTVRNATTFASDVINILEKIARIMNFG